MQSNFTSFATKPTATCQQADKTAVHNDTSYWARLSSLPDNIDDFCQVLAKSGYIPKLLRDKSYACFLASSSQSTGEHVMSGEGQSVESSPILGHTCYRRILASYLNPRPNEPFWESAECPITLTSSLLSVPMPDGHVFAYETLGELFTKSTGQIVFHSPLTFKTYPIPPTIRPSQYFMELGLYRMLYEGKSIDLTLLRENLENDYFHATQALLLSKVSWFDERLSKCIFWVYYVGSCIAEYTRSMVYADFILGKDAMQTSPSFGLFPFHKFLSLNRNFIKSCSMRYLYLTRILFFGPLALPPFDGLNIWRFSSDVSCRFLISLLSSVLIILPECGRNSNFFDLNIFSSKPFLRFYESCPMLVRSAFLGTFSMPYFYDFSAMIIRRAWGYFYGIYKKKMVVLQSSRVIAELNIEARVQNALQAAQEDLAMYQSLLQTACPGAERLT